MWLAPTSKYAHARIRFLSLFLASFLVTFQQKKYTGSACVFSLSYLLKWFLENDLDTPISILCGCIVRKIRTVFTMWVIFLRCDQSGRVFCR